jgi:hypothetical protein
MNIGVLNFQGVGFHLRCKWHKLVNAPLWMVGVSSCLKLKMVEYPF